MEAYIVEDRELKKLTKIMNYNQINFNAFIKYKKQRNLRKQKIAVLNNKSSDIEACIIEDGEY